MQPDGDTDGIPVALMEAMAAGCRWWRRGCSGVPELVRDGETGLLVPPGDAAALADALRTLRAEPEAASRARGGPSPGRGAVRRGGPVSRLLALIRASSLRPAGGRRAGAINVAGDARLVARPRGSPRARGVLPRRRVRRARRARTWKFYDAGARRARPLRRAVTAAARPGASVLEYGCGPGDRACALARARSPRPWDRHLARGHRAGPRAPRARGLRPTRPSP